jgi:SAM-dependent methyltransferase
MITREEEFEFQALWNAKNYRAAIEKEFVPYLRGEVLEAGSGIGQFSNNILRCPNVKNLICVEPNEEFIKRHKVNNNVEQHVHGIAQSLLGSTHVDAIVSVNVLEHIQDDQNELNTYLQLLSKKQGHLCLLVPARPEIYAQIDRRFGHFRRYTKPELQDKISKAGFIVEKIFYYNFIGYFAWWFVFCFLKSYSFNPGSVRLFDRFIFPPVNWIERFVFRPPFGQSIVLIARSQ